MTIPITREPPDMGVLERCCFCRAPTEYWTALKERTPGQQVACCQQCAKTRAPEEAPSKRAWFQAEDIAMRKEGRYMP